MKLATNFNNMAKPSRGWLPSSPPEGSLELGSHHDRTTTHNNHN